MVWDWKNEYGGEFTNVNKPVRSSVFIPRYNYTEEHEGVVPLYDRARVKSGSRSPVVTHKGVYPFRVPTNYERYVCLFKHTPGEWEQWQYGGWPQLTKVSGYYPLGSTLDTTFGDYGRRSVSDELRQRSIVECLLRLKDGKATLSANLAETIMAADDLGRASIELLTLLRAARRGSWGLVRKQFGKALPPSVTNQYLRLHFGVLPLMSDVYGTYEVFSGLADRPHVLSASKQIRGRRTLEPTDRWGNIRDARDQFSELCRTSLWATVENAELANASRVGLTDPLSVAWEIVPWSFVLDWFVPVGNMLEALNATVGLGFLAGSITSKVEGQFTGIRNGSLTELKPQIVTADYVCHRREALGDFPKFKPYAVRNPFSTSRIVTALALWRQLTR